MCCPTVSARAVTLVKMLQSSDEQKANVRRLPADGGTRAAPNARARPSRRRKPSNWTAVDRGGAGWLTYCAISGATGPTVAVRSWNGDDRLNVPAADCATIRYSAESTIDALAGKVTHPASAAGSIDVSAPTARVNAVACAVLQVGPVGAVAVLPPHEAAVSNRIETEKAAPRVIVVSPSPGPSRFML